MMIERSVIVSTSIINVHTFVTFINVQDKMRLLSNTNVFYGDNNDDISMFQN